MDPVKPDIHFPRLEQDTLSFWEREGIIEKGLRANAGKPGFVFYDGPPFATGLPHYGHILPGTLKDIVPRYWAMKGRYVERRWGWDCHGVPVEFELEKELGLNGLADVQKMGIANFNEACRAIVQRYTKEWEQVITRTGRWVDFKNAYRTMDPKYMESIWWITRQLWDQGLIYEGHRVMPYSWRISTPLSNFEASLNYKEVQDPALTVRFRVTGKHARNDRGGQRYFLAWTTTPWTLPTNLALAVGGDIEYVEVAQDEKSGDSYILAGDRLGAYFHSAEGGQTVKQLATYRGRDLVGWTYEPLFNYFLDRKSAGAFQVLEGPHVTATDGTGVVHTAPAHGEEDYLICQKAGIELADATDAEGKFTERAPEYQGLPFKEADKPIIRDLKERGLIFRHETYTHNYPFCWRSDTPLMNKAISTWFVRLDPLKARLIENNRGTHWVPEHLRDGRFGNWLENARDWNISRNRFWGTPLPLWRSEDKTETLCVESLDELEKLSGQRPADLHKHFVDDITFKSPKTGKLLRRIPEVFDCWFESGSMPYAQQHYPFENRKTFEQVYPADFIAEGVDQTRGWFYTLSVLSTALFDKAPFKNVIVNGLVLAEDGKKMSKRLKNYPEPQKVLEEYGADALRAYLMNSPAAHAEDLRFSENGVKEVVRSVLLPLWNAYGFFVTYALADGWKPQDFKLAHLDELNDDLDRWVLSRLQSLIQSYEKKMEVYHLSEVIPEVLGFIDQLTNWYIRLNRRRFWSEERNADKAQAYSTLYFVLMEFAKVLAPILPFITEQMYQNLKGEAEPPSVHLNRFPQYRAQWVDTELEEQMRLVETVVAMGRTCRNTHKLKTRQPLREIKVITREPSDKKTIERYQSLIARELNVKSVSFSSEESRWVTLSAKANAKVLGPRLGTKMKAVLQKVKALSAEAVAAFEKTGTLEVEGETLTKEEVVVERQPKQAGAMQTSGTVTIWLDSNVDDALIAEGRAREFVNRVQKLRKDSGLDVTDHIRLEYEAPPVLQAAIMAHQDYILSEVLGEELKPVSVSDGSTEEIDGMALKLRLERV